MNLLQQAVVCGLAIACGFGIALKLHMVLIDYLLIWCDVNLLVALLSYELNRGGEA